MISIEGVKMEWNSFIIIGCAGDWFVGKAITIIVIRWRGTTTVEEEVNKDAVGSSLKLQSVAHKFILNRIYSV